MNSKLLVIHSDNISQQLKNHVDQSLLGLEYDHYRVGMSCQNRKIIFVTELNKIGYDFDLLKWLNDQADQKAFFSGSTAALIVMSQSELFTKSFAQDVLLHANERGLSFIGHSVVEIISGYRNFQTWLKTSDKTLEEICNDHCRQLVLRLINEKKPTSTNVLALHSSSYKTSNTLGLWSKVKDGLKLLGCIPEEIHIENGTVVDCKGCQFQTCMHFGENKSCFYGGVMVEEVLPAIEAADIIVWVCPNYNDAISANLLAVINRLTVLYRQISFRNKVFYAIVVSGNSGSDSVAKQLIGALNINKGFYLPPNFALMEIANEPLKVLEIEGITKKTSDFAEQINTFCQEHR